MSRRKVSARAIYLGSGERAERAWDAWTTFVSEQGFPTNAHCLEWLLQHARSPAPAAVVTCASYKNTATQCELDTQHQHTVLTPGVSAVLLQSVEASQIQEARRQSSDRISTPVRRALVLHLQQKSTAFALSSPIDKDATLTSLHKVDASVEPVTEESEPEFQSWNDVVPSSLHFSTIKSRKRSLSQRDLDCPVPPESNETVHTSISQEGHLEVTLNDDSCEGLDRCIGQDEEFLIQEVVDKLDSPEGHTSPEEQDTIDEDVYKHIRYGSLQDELKLINERKCFAYIWSLLQLLGEKCREKSCFASIETTNVLNCGYCVKLEWKCAEGHHGTWYSSPPYASGFGINYLINTALLVSGGTIAQFHHFCDFLGLMRENQDSFYRNQRLFAAPAINQVYEEGQKDIITSPKFQGRKLVVCGGDSEGFSATKATYSFMEHGSNIVLHMEHGDKRQVNLKSISMEAHLFKKGLVALRDMAQVEEVCTSANEQVVSVFKRVPAFKDIFHSLDIWQKASKISKKLAEAASKKPCRELAQWIPTICDHFYWVCAKVAKCHNETRDGDAAKEKIRELWVGIIQHVCGSHERAGGRCEHTPEQDSMEPDGGKTYLNPESPAADALRSVVFDTRLLRSLDYYIRSRHTGQLEILHNLMMAYAPKCLEYRHEGYRARMQLACMDHNAHCNRPQLTRKDGTLVFCRKWSKKCGQWSAIAVPSRKTYDYVPDMMARILYRRHVVRYQLREDM